MAVVGVPDERAGQLPRVFIVPDDNLTEEAVRISSIDEDCTFLAALAALCLPDELTVMHIHCSEFRAFQTRTTRWLKRLPTWRMVMDLEVDKGGGHGGGHGG